MVHIARTSEDSVEQEAVEVEVEESVGIELLFVQQSISSLCEEDYRKLKEWMEEEEDWDREMEQAAKSGALDFLIDEVEEAKAKGLLRMWVGYAETYGA